MLSSNRDDDSLVRCSEQQESEKPCLRNGLRSFLNVSLELSQLPLGLYTIQFS